MRCLFAVLLLALALPATTAAAPRSPLDARLVRIGYLPAASVSGEATVEALIAFQKQEGLAGDGVAGPQTKAALKRAVRPAPPRPLARAVEISLSHQLLYLVSYGVALRTIAVSTAAPGHVTPQGRFRVYRKETLSWSVPYSSWMPYASYFDGGWAIHGYPSVPVYPASHGCVRVPLIFDREVYTFASIGTPVLVLP